MNQLEQIQHKAIEEMFDTEYMTEKQPNLNPDTLKKVINKAYQAGKDSVDEKVKYQFAWESGYKAGQEAERGSQNKIFKTLRLILHDIQSYEPEGEVNTLCEQGLLELNLINSKE